MKVETAVMPLWRLVPHDVAAAAPVAAEVGGEGSGAGGKKKGGKAARVANGGVPPRWVC